MPPSRSCPCHSGRPYAACCQPLHAGAPAATPEALMRSRYAAYALGLADYIIDTTDPDGPAWEGGSDDAARGRWRASIQRFSRAMTFRGLRIVATTLEGPAAGTVHFRAELAQNGRPGAMEELSRFVHRGGNWRYSAGEPRR